MTVLRTLIDGWLRLLTVRPGALLVGFLLLCSVAGYGASRLTVNTNQLDLISQDLRQVKDVKRVVDMIGGAGHLILALRGNDEKLLMAVSDDINAHLLADKARVRAVTYKVPTEFLRANAAMFMQTADLKELRRRVMLKLRDVLKRASPFYMEIRPTPPVELKTEDIINKYTKVGKKSITDDHYISQDRQMLLLLIKPMWDSNQLERTGELVEATRDWLKSWPADNPHGVRFVEDYNRDPNRDAKVIEFGFAGSYQTNYDDSYELKKSLVPVSGVALLGVFAVLLMFFRRRIVAVAVVLSGLLLGVVLTMGFAALAIGELNMITGILAGILMGLGIDFGIHLVVRLSEELDRGRALEDALRETVKHSGVASAVSGAGTAAAFFSLLFSEFAGFSQFGLLAGAGVLIIGTTLYLWVPVVLLLIERRWSGSVRKLVGGLVTLDTSGEARHRVPRPGLLLALGVAIALLMAVRAPEVAFEYNTRALMVENQPSVLLQDEINARFQISADPVAIYTPDLAAARRVYDRFHPLDPKRFSTVDQLVSLYSLVPPADQQARNAAELKSWLEELAEIDRASLPPEFEEKWDKAMKYLKAKPYGLEGLPEHLRNLWISLPTAKPENRGVLTFVYPVVDLWDGKQMLKFAEEVEEVPIAEGEVYYSAGMPILFAKLARIVLFDGKFSVALTAVLLLLVLLVDLRSLRATAVALLPLLLGVGMMLGAMVWIDFRLNFMNVVVFPIVLGYGLSHGVYLIHRFREGSSAMDALRSVGTAVACSTLTTLAGWAALLAASHRGLKSMGMLACLGMSATLIVTFMVMPALLQLLHDRRTRKEVA